MRTKRLLSLVMALCMLFTITAPGFAWALEDDAEPGEVITDVGPQQEDPVEEEPAPDPEPEPEPEEPAPTQEEPEEPATEPEEETTKDPVVDYYLVGSMNGWAKSDNYKFSVNPNADGEWMLKDVSFTANAEVKVKDSNDQWYPNNQGNKEINAGVYDFYFRTDGQGQQPEWHYGYFYADKHTLAEHAANDATCTEAGNSAYWQCNKCGKYFSDADHTAQIAANSWVISALGHTWGGWTYGDNGATRKCSRCEYSETVAYPQAVVTALSVANPVTVDGEYYQLAKLVRFDFANGQPTEAQLDAFGDWYCDYVVYADHYVPANSMGLYGAYGGLARVLTSGEVIPANQPITLVNGVMGGDLRFKDIYTIVHQFTCGAFDVNYINAGTTLHVELRIWDGAGHTHTVNTMTHTFESAPVATVTINGGEPQPVDAPVTVTVTDATVTFTAAAAEALAGEGALTLTVTKTALNEHSATFTIELKNASNENVFTTESGNAAATVSIPWTGDVAPLVYLVEGNTRTAVTGVSIVEGKAVFTVPHFSVYEVVNASCVARFVQSGATKYATTLQEAVAGADAGSTVTLLSDVDATGSMYFGDTRFNLWISKSITLDLASHTLTVKGRGIGIQGASGNIDVTIKNGTVTNHGNVNGRCIDTRGKLNSLTLDNVTLTTAESSYTGYLQPLTIGGNQTTAATVTIKDSNIIVNNAANKGYAITTFNPVNMTITGSTIKGWACLNLKGPDSSAGSSGSDITVSSSALVSANGTPGDTNAYSLIKIEADNVNVAISGSTLNVDGGSNLQSIVSISSGNTHFANSSVTLGAGNTVNLSGTCALASNTGTESALNITGGTFNVDDNAVFTYYNTNISISGGTFNVEVPAAYCASGYIPKDNGDGTYGVKTGSYVAQIGNVKYETLSEAIAEVGSGETIKMIANVTNAPGMSVASGKNFTVDFDGHTYTVSKPGAGSTGTETSAFQLLKNSTITFKNGTISVSEDNLTAAVAPAKNILRVFQNYANLTLDNMTIDARNQYGSYQGGKYGLSFNNGTSVIKDTKIITSGDDAVAFDVYLNDYYTATSVSIEGTSAITGTIEVAATNAAQGEHLALALNGGTLSGDILMGNNAAEAAITKASTFTQEAPEGYKWSEAVNGVQTLVEAHYVAENTTTGTKYETLAEAIAEVGSGETIKMIANVTNAPGMSVASGKNFTVDFDGHTYTVSKPGAGSTGTETSAFQLLKDSTIVFKNGTISVSEDNLTEAVAPAKNILRVFQNYANLTLDNMTIDARNQYGYYQGGKYGLSFNNGTSVIKDTTIITSGNDVVAFDVYLNTSYTATSVTVQGNSAITGTIEVAATNATQGEHLALALNGGTLSGAIKMGNNAAEATITKADTFEQEAPTGYVWVAGETAGTQTIAKAVAQIGNTAYASLEAAVAAAVDGNTITLLGDCEGNGIVFPQGKFGTNGLTIDFDGHTYNVSGTPVGSTGTETIGFQLLKDNNITLKDGTLTGSSRTNRDLVRMIQNYSNLTLDNMIISLVGQYYNQTTMSNCNGATVINNSTVNAPDFTWAGINDPASVGGAAFSVGTFSTYTSASVAVTGTSTINGDVKVDPDNNYAANNVLTLTGGTLNGDIIMVDNANEATVTKADTFEQEAPADYEWVSNGNGTSTLVAIVYAASITKNEVTTKYRTLEAAFAAAQDGDTIVMLDNSVEAGEPVLSLNGSVTLDLNGKEVTANDDIWVKTGNLTVIGASGSKITSSGYAFYVSTTSIANNAATLTINSSDVTISADGVATIAVMPGGTVNLQAGTIEATAGNGIASNGTYSGAAINISGGVINGYDLGIYLPSGSLTVSGGTITGKTAVYVKSGTVSITDGILHGTGDAAAYSFNGNGGNPTGDALVVDNCKYPGGAPTVTISGGTFNSDNGKGIGAYTGNGVTELASVTATSNTITIPADEKWVAEGTGYKLVKKAYVAQIGNDKYETLEAAFAAAADGNTITLLADVALTERLFVNAGATPSYAGTGNRYATTSENKAITLNLNGHNITSSSNIALAGGSLNITGTGTISTSVSGLAPIEIRGTGDLTNKRTLTIGQNVTLTGSEYGLNVFGSNDAQKNTIDVTVNGTVNGILFVLGNLTNADNAINIVVNGTVAAPAAAANESPNVGIALNGVANVTVNAGAAVSGDSGIEVRAGRLTVNGGSITANAVEYGYTANGSGSTTKGAAIAVAQHTTAKPVAVVLNGGTLTGGVKQIAVTDVNNNDLADVTVIATESYTQNSTIPEGYEWVETSTTGVYTLAKKAVEVAGLKATGAALATEGRIIVRIGTEPIEGSTIDHVTLTINGRTKKVSYSKPDLTSDNGNTKLFNMPVYAKEMDDDVVLKAFDASNNQLKILRSVSGEWVEVDEYRYSVKTYINTTPEGASYEKLVDMMGVYGDYAKYYFQHPYGTSSMPGGYPLEQIDASALEAYKAVTNGSLGNIAYVGGALALEEGTYIRVFFSGNVDGYTFHCNNEVLTPVAYGSLHYVTIDNVAAKELDTMYTVEVTDGTNTYSVQYSALTYVRSVLSDNSDPQTLKDVVTALYWYNQEANKYFH